MKKMILAIMLTCVCISPAKVLADNYDITMKQDILCLMMAYKDYIVDIEKDSNKNVYLVTKSDKKILYDDKKKKNFEQKLYNTDLQDMMEQPYPQEPIDKVMEKDLDPGRFRVYALLNEVYGCNKNSVESNLRMVNLGYGNLQFNGNNEASNCLKNAMKELIPLSRERTDIARCLFPGSGTFNYRCISGTNLLSPHSFGIAIDLARDRRDYWKWVSKEEGNNRIKEYPKEIVEIFEKNNFVWGGKWSHFDILHFEYRPEIILKAKYFKQQNKNEKYWYESVPCEDEFVKNCIKKIDEKL
ncbi:M15 family metallopeptidase [Clostridium sp. WILCCON 0269]|uniref:M15 family metallopeptidase n=1 Tax=Candidatus Clostridium eludens TaxID=3381663 RepID=A0ABW8SMZ2_9CLOT